MNAFGGVMGIVEEHNPEELQIDASLICLLKSNRKPTETMMRHLDVEDKNENGLDLNPINEKKATATSAKLLQLPQNTNEEK